MPAHLIGCVGIDEQCRTAADQGERGACDLRGGTVDLDGIG
jgi:hypothetical protein